mgnify:CR=1 FL=1
MKKGKRGRPKKSVELVVKKTKKVKHKTPESETEKEPNNLTPQPNATMSDPKKPVDVPENIVDIAEKLGVDTQSISTAEEYKEAISEKISPAETVPTPTYEPEVIPQVVNAAPKVDIYNDVNAFATQGVMKQLHQIEAKLKEHGASYSIVREGELLVAFNIDGGIRLPATGFYRVE